MKRIGLLLLFVSLLSYSNAQEDIKSEVSKEKRIERHRALRPDIEKLAAIKFAEKNKIPIRVIDENGRIIEIRRILNDVHPEYLITHNLTAAKTISTKNLWDGEVESMFLDGDGIVAGVWDAGDIRTSHVEFGTRVESFDSDLGIIGHATHVAGTIAAAGNKPEAHGMADHISIEGYDWINDVAEMAIAAEDGMILSNHSYGLIHGFHYNIEEERWEWFGYTSISEKEDYNFGFYGSDARSWDSIAYRNPNYLIVKSVGNDRFEGPEIGEGHYVWQNRWVESDSVRSIDGGPEGFDCIGTESTAKNILAVGAVGDIESGYQTRDDVIIASYSAFGPTDDGRIKPDIVANGQGLLSTYDRSDTDYMRASGTSMSAPSVTGSLALIQQFHYAKFSTYLKSSTLKAIILHTADEAGNTGPDYMYGWGLMNSKKAAEFISESVTRNSTIIENQVNENQSQEYYLYMYGDNDGRITNCWTDPPGKVPQATLDPNNSNLINDLDMQITRLSDQQIYNPYILDPLNPDLPATTGNNFRDNIEQINLPGVEGFYKLTITQKVSSSNSTQNFSLVCDGLFPVSIASEFDTLYNVNGEIRVTDAPVCPSNSNFSWLIQPENNESILFTFSSFETSINDVLKIYDGSSSSADLIGEFSGEMINTDTLISSSGSSLFLEFHTGDNSASKGFVANYCTRPPDKILSIIGEDMPCIGNLEIYNIPTESGIEYTWGISLASPDTSLLNNSNIEIDIKSSEFDLFVTPNNSCGVGETTDLHIVPISEIPDIRNEIIGDTLPCLNLQNNYTVQYDAISRYNWIVPDGWSSSNDSSTIWLKPEVEKGILMVVPYNSCGVDDTIKLSVVGKRLPPEVVITSDVSSPCQNSIQELYVQATAGIEYKWETDKNWKINGEDSLSRVTVLIGEGIIGNIVLTSSNLCGDSIVSTNFFFSPQPDRPEIQVQESIISGYNELVLSNYSSFSSVSWLLNDSILSSNTNAILVQRNGEYGVEVANSEGCTRTLEHGSRISINEDNLLFSIYGVNTPGLFAVINDSGEDALLEGFDLFGKTLFIEDLQPGTNYFHTHDRGVIILKITGSESSHKQMIILP